MAIVIVQAGGDIAVDQIVHTTFYTWTQGQYGLFGISHRINTVSFGMNCGDYAEAMQTLFQPLFQPLIANPVKLLGARVGIQLPVNNYAAGVATSTSVGSGGANQVVLQQSGLVSFRSAVRGPAGRGRAYIPFPSTQALTAITGQPEAAYVSDLQVLANDMSASQNITAPSAGLNANISPVIFHRDFNTSTDIVTGIASDRWATQRRRGDFGRQNPDVIPL